DIGDEQPDEDAEGDHDGENPVVELILLADASDKCNEQAESNASEGTVGEGIAEERHAIANDKRADRPAGEADEQDRERTADLKVDVEEGVGREAIVEGPDHLIEPGAEHTTPPDTTPTRQRGNDMAPATRTKTTRSVYRKRYYEVSGHETADTRQESLAGSAEQGRGVRRCRKKLPPRAVP